MKETDDEKVDQATLALLYLNHMRSGSAWKSFDWNAMDRLHEKGLISSPVSKAKSVRFSEEGLAEAARCFERCFCSDQ